MAVFIGLGLLAAGGAGWWLWKRHQARKRRRISLAPRGFIDELMATRRQAETAMLAVLLERRRP